MLTYSATAKTNKKLVTIDVDEGAEKALKLMQEKKIRHLIVLSDGTVCGLLSNRDLMKAYKVEIQDFYSVKIKDEQLQRNLTVRDLMSWPLVSVSDDTPLIKVIDTLLEQKISSVLIKNSQNEVQDIVTTDDLLVILKTYVSGSKPSFWEKMINDETYMTPIRNVMEVLANTGI